MITLSKVSKWCPNFQVLKHCSTEVAKGEVVVVCGPSGSGKSTLLSDPLMVLVQSKSSRWSFVGTVFQRKSTAAPRHFKIWSSSSARATVLAILFPLKSSYRNELPTGSKLQYSEQEAQHRFEAALRR
jgi:ABC-type polar amino acid transport system ATPase subunit